LAETSRWRALDSCYPESAATVGKNVPIGATISQREPLSAGYWARIGAIAAAYYGSAKLGLDLAFATESVTAVWPPTGIALAALVLWGPRMWPGVLLGAFLANAWTAVPAVTVLGITCGNTLEAVVGAHLLRRFAVSPSLERVRDVLAFVGLAAVLSTTVSATIGVCSLIIGDEVQAGSFWSVWRVWWLGDMGGDLLVATAIMVAATHWPFRRLPGAPWEAVVLAGLSAGLSLVVFQREANLAYLLLPVLIWAVLRFWQPGVCAASLIVAGIGVAFTANDSGPFVRPNPDDSLLLAQTYFGVTGITMLLLAAVVTERRKAEDLARHIAATLQQSLVPRTLPDIPSVEVAARYRASGAAHRVGGDFYDVFEAGDGVWALAIGDVCGKGAEAAAVTALARYTIREAAVDESRPSAVLARLNAAIRRQRPANEFCTAAFLELRVRDGGADLVFATGGHPLPVLLRAGETAETVGHHGIALGIRPDPELTDERIELRPGDALLVYTDGLTDCFAPARMLGPEDIASIVSRFDGQPAEAIARGVEAAVLGDERAEPRDDIALLVLRLRPT
jgi:integral membrane sensor domain MASE1